MYNEYQAPEAAPAPAGQHKGFNPVFYFVPIIVTTLFFVLAVVLPVKGYQNNGFNSEIGVFFSIAMIIGGISSIFGVVFYYIAVYRAWKLLQNSSFPRTSPAKAVGFQFIPFFNFYWMFQAYYGYAVDFNAYIRHKNYQIPPLNPSIFMASCILTLCCIIPVLGYVAMLATFVLSIICTVQMINRTNALAAIRNAEDQNALSA